MHYMYSVFKVRPVEMKAIQGLDEPGKLKIEPGDKITVIDGKTDHYYWKGQNKRTCEVGWVNGNSLEFDGDSVVKMVGSSRTGVCAWVCGEGVVGWGYGLGVNRKVQLHTD